MNLQKIYQMMSTSGDDDPFIASLWADCSEEEYRNLGKDPEVRVRILYIEVEE